ncbi:hypothetical protein ACFL5U_04040 [Candidatus Margulisiibacteriota bacterium]
MRSRGARFFFFPLLAAVTATRSGRKPSPKKVLVIEAGAGEITRRTIEESFDRRVAVTTMPFHQLAGKPLEAGAIAGKEFDIIFINGTHTLSEKDISRTALLLTREGVAQNRIIIAVKKEEVARAAIKEGFRAVGPDAYGSYIDALAAMIER